MPRPAPRGRGKGKGGKFAKGKDGRQQNRGLFRRRKFCRFTAEKVKEVDYKDIAVLKDFINENRRTELEKKANEQLTGAQERAAKLEGTKIDMAQKAGVDGRLFGSVTNADIAEGLTKATGIAVKKAEIRMPQGPLKHVGEFPI